MFKNYYLFQQQIADISPQIRGAVIQSIFTVHKNELIFSLEKSSDLKQLAISIDPARPYILLQNQHHYKDAKFNKFEQLYGEVINNIEILFNNKYIRIEFAAFVINAFFYSNFPNILLYDLNGQLLDAFKTKKTTKIIDTPPEEYDKICDSEITEYISKVHGVRIKDVLKHIFPAANNQMQSELFKRLDCNGNDSIEKMEPNNVSGKLVAFRDEIKSGNAYIYRQNKIAKYLLLYKSEQYSTADFQIEAFQSVNKAWSVFTHEHQKHADFEKLIHPILKAIDKRKHVLQTTLAKLAEAEDIESRKQEADLKGNLIIANKHKIPRSADRIELINIFSDQQEKVLIKLNPKKSAVENASYYFQKYKNIAEKKQVIELKKDTYSKELEELSQIEEKTYQATNKDLLKIKEQLVAMNVLQVPVIKEKTKQSLKYAFKRLILENAWDIYIGKNNLNNEQLTFEFASKWDIWLHAQGVSGSHVLIKLPGKNVTTPKHIIEQAAQIAAFNSKAKHSGTVPVIYTQVRYISKIRGAQPGTVNVKNEKVIFVKPLNLNQ